MSFLKFFIVICGFLIAAPIIYASPLPGMSAGIVGNPKNRPIPPQIQKAAKLFTMALKEQQANHIDKAIELYKKILTFAPNAVPVYMNLGIISEQKQDYIAAIQYYKKAESLDKKNIAAPSQLALVYLQVGKKADAKIEAQRALVINPKSSQAHFAMGGYYTSSGNLPMAVKEYQRCVQLDPANPQVHFTLAYSLALEQKYAEALKELKKVLKLNPRHPDANLYIGIILERQHNYNAAITSFIRATKVMPSNPAAWYNLAVAYQTTGEITKKNEYTQEAISAYLQTLNLAPDYMGALVNVGRLYYKLGNYGEAAKHFEKAASLSPKDSRLQSDTGLACMMASSTASAATKTEWMTEAETHYKLGLEIKPLPAIYSGLSYLYTVQNKPDMTEKICEQWVNHFPKDSVGWEALARQRQVSKNDMEAEADYLNAIKYSPNTPSYRIDLASFYESQNKNDLAANQLLEAEKVSPKNPEPYRQLGSLYERTGKYDDAIAQYKTMKGIAPGDSSPYLSIASIYEEQKKTTEAIQEYNALQKIMPGNPMPLMYIARVQEAQKKYDDAISTYKQIQQMKPEDGWVAANIARLDELSNRDDLALTEYRRILIKDPKNVMLMISIAQILEKQNMLDDAAKEYQLVLNQDKSNGFAAAQLGGIYRKQNKYADAISVYQSMLSNPANVEKAYMELEKTFDQENKPEEWGKYLETRVSANPADITAMEHLESWGMKQNKKADVQDFLHGIAASNGKNKAFMLQYAALLERDGDQAGSLAAYENAAHITPDDYQTLETAAGENAFAGRNENAIKLYQEAIECKTLPVNMKVDIQLRMAGLYEKIGRKENALKLYKEVQKTDPSNIVAAAGAKRLGG